jgi:hypothetical protein
MRAALRVAIGSLPASRSLRWASAFSRASASETVCDEHSRQIRPDQVKIMMQGWRCNMPQPNHILLNL